MYIPQTLEQQSAYNHGLEVALRQIDREISRLEGIAKTGKKWTTSRISALRTLAASISVCKVVIS